MFSCLSLKGRNLPATNFLPYLSLETPFDSRPSPSVTELTFFCGTGFPTKKTEEPQKAKTSLYNLVLFVGN